MNPKTLEILRAGVKADVADICAGKPLAEIAATLGYANAASVRAIGYSLGLRLRVGRRRQ